MPLVKHTRDTFVTKDRQDGGQKYVDTTTDYFYVHEDDEPINPDGTAHDGRYLPVIFGVALMAPLVIAIVVGMFE